MKVDLWQMSNSEKSLVWHVASEFGSTFSKDFNISFIFGFRSFFDVVSGWDGLC